MVSKATRSPSSSRTSIPPSPSSGPHSSASFRLHTLPAFVASYSAISDAVISSIRALFLWWVRGVTMSDAPPDSMVLQATSTW